MPLTDAQREYHRAWSKANWEKRKASQYKWREKNKERIKEIDKRCYDVTKSQDKPQRMLQAARYRAKQVGLPCDITKEDIVIPEYCPVLPWIKLGSGNQETRPELDKINPALGYVKGNVCVISGRANRLKDNATVEEIEHVLAYVKSRLGAIDE